jgi:hypothetical protein
MIPKRVKIGGKIVDIDIIENADALQIDDISSNWGISRYDENKIILKRLKSEEEMEETLAHEIKHFFDAISGRKHYLQSKEVDYELQNVMTDNVFWQFLKDNTDFYTINVEKTAEAEKPKERRK